MKNVLFKIVLLLSVVVSVGIMGCEEAKKTTGGDLGYEDTSFLKGTWSNSDNSITYIFDGNTYELHSPEAGFDKETGVFVLKDGFIISQTLRKHQRDGGDADWQDADNISSSNQYFLINGILTLVADNGDSIELIREY